MPKFPKTSKKKQKKMAVALRYDQSKETTPKLIGKGHGPIADKILELAKEHGIPIQQDSDLVEILYRLNLNEEIPAETYLVVAEILAFVYRTNKNYPGPATTP